MKKVLLSFDGNHYSAGAFEFARSLNEHEPIQLTGVFLSPADFTMAWSDVYSGGSLYNPVVENKESGLLKGIIDKFEAQCKEHGITYRIHQDTSSYSLEELKKESRFADLMILGSQQFYANLGLKKPNDYLRNALHSTECPVVVVPEAASFPESIVLAYDGSRSSVYAIKSFALLFPHLCNRKTIIIYARHTGEEGMPDEKLIRELAGNHFSNIRFYELEADQKKYLNTWLSDIEKPMLVSGSYGRSGFSQVFRQSFIADVIADHHVPVFIAHL